MSTWIRRNLKEKGYHYMALRKQLKAEVYVINFESLISLLGLTTHRSQQ